ncbi:MAG: hypothetical protein ACR2OR_09090 [Hyphomicrobiales bacterium]
MKRSLCIILTMPWPLLGIEEAQSIFKPGSFLYEPEQQDTVDRLEKMWPFNR